MKKFIKKSVLLLFAVVLVLSMTACGGNAKKDTFDTSSSGVTARNVIALMQHADDLGLSQLADAEEEELLEFESWIKNNGLPIKGSAFKDGYTSYLDAVNGDLGEVVSVGEDVSVDADDETVNCHVALTGTKTFPDGITPRTATAEIIMTRGGTITSAVINVDRTFNEKIVNAALNTVLGMGTTFCLLIFISIVIWLMGTIVQNMEKKKHEERVRTESAVDNAAKQIVEREEQLRNNSGAADEQALIAVISAAIAAYESGVRGVNVTPDTFIVRSLRRR